MSNLRNNRFYREPYSTPAGATEYSDYVLALRRALMNFEARLDEAMRSFRDSSFWECESIAECYGEGTIMDHLLGEARQVLKLPVPEHCESAGRNECKDCAGGLVELNQALQIVLHAKDGVGAGGIGEKASWERQIVSPYLDRIEDEIRDLIDARMTRTGSTSPAAASRTRSAKGG